MVKYSASKAKFSQTLKNLNGIDTTLRIDKQGKCLCAILERKLSSCIYENIIQFCTCLILFTFVNYFVFNNCDIWKYTLVFAGIFFKFAFTVREEALIMVHSLGYQITSKYVIGQKDLFIPWNQVQNIFINEVIIKHRVIHVMTILTKDAKGEQIIPLFLDLQPRLRHLELISKHLKATNS